jgi:hypothetical protein
VDFAEDPLSRRLLGGAENQDLSEPVWRNFRIGLPKPSVLKETFGMSLLPMLFNVLGQNQWSGQDRIGWGRNNFNGCWGNLETLLGGLNGGCFGNNRYGYNRYGGGGLYSRPDQGWLQAGLALQTIGSFITGLATVFGLGNNGRYY